MEVGRSTILNISEAAEHRGKQFRGSAGGSVSASWSLPMEGEEVSEKEYQGSEICNFVCNIVMIGASKLKRFEY